MKSKAITDNSQLKAIEIGIDSYREHYPFCYVFFSAIYYHGYRQEQLFSFTLKEICLISPSYDVILAPYSSNDLFKDYLPSRNHIYSILNSGLNIKINVTTLFKTWVYRELLNGKSVNNLISYLGYKNSIFLFLTEYLGLSSDVCLKNQCLKYIYISSCLRELSSKNFVAYTDSELKLINSHISAIFDIIS